MASISDPIFLNNVEKSLTIAHLSDLPLPFLIIDDRLYHNASREQIYGIMYLDGTPLSLSDKNYSNKRFRDLPASAIIEYYEKIERLNLSIKEIVLNTVGVSAPLTKNYNQQDYQTLHNSLFGTSGFFATSNGILNSSNISILSDLFKELLNASKGVKI